MMNDEKMLVFAKKLQEEHVVCFRLYNALYKVQFSQKKLTIRQEGLDVSYTYSSLHDLFHYYVVYGASLIDSLEDIKMI